MEEHPIPRRPVKRPVGLLWSVVHRRSLEDLVLRYWKAQSKTAERRTVTRFALRFVVRRVFGCVKRNGDGLGTVIDVFFSTFCILVTFWTD